MFCAFPAQICPACTKDLPHKLRVGSVVKLEIASYTAACAQNQAPINDFPSPPTGAGERGRGGGRNWSKNDKL